MEELNIDTREELTAEAQAEQNAKAVVSKFYRASLQSWFMKPLVATSGMTEGTINEAEVLKAMAFDFGSLVEIGDIGISAAALRNFQDAVPKTEYRLQCLHHAACLGVKEVLFITAKGSAMGVGEVIYAVLLRFTVSIRNDYLYCLDTVKCAAFLWIGKDAQDIPVEYVPML